MSGLAQALLLNGKGINHDIFSTDALKDNGIDLNHHLLQVFGQRVGKAQRKKRRDAVIIIAAKPTTTTAAYR